MRNMCTIHSSASAPGDYSEGQGAAQVRESVSDGSTGGPAAILFVLKASDYSLVFNLHEALDGPSALQPPHTDPQPLWCCGAIDRFERLTVAHIDSAKSRLSAWPRSKGAI